MGKQDFFCFLNIKNKIFPTGKNKALDKLRISMYNKQVINAPVVKLAYTIDLGSISVRSAGSTPVRRTKKEGASFDAPSFLYPENHAIVAWFKRGYCR